MGAGRPTDYTFDKVKAICLRLADGERLTDILREPDMPSRTSFFDWKREHQEFADLYTRTQQDKTEHFIDEIDDTMKELKAKGLDPASANVIIQTLKWKAAKFYPKMFGEKVDVAVKAEGVQIVFERAHAKEDS
jgi:hypothetical protein